ncbi:unnamed protein product [Albugo candida]|uniref:Uncharacterized protein n=1 Tax=Albugo candida TaxID=65357 RepID=A0A024GEJ8_9STRA|nr:unnamed protein product [Albugo candida]|eukprot:CCI45119.1 unnamed protein product [Albugo candida]
MSLSLSASPSPSTSTIAPEDSTFTALQQGVDEYEESNELFCVKSNVSLKSYRAAQILSQRQPATSPVQVWIECCKRCTVFYI